MCKVVYSGEQADILSFLGKIGTKGRKWEPKQVILGTSIIEGVSALASKGDDPQTGRKAVKRFF